MAKLFHLGCYIKPEHIKKAFDLLEYQLEQKSPLYNNIDYSIYRLYSTSINPIDFYNDFIKRDSFYYFQALALRLN